MELEAINPLISQIISILDKEEIPGVILTINTKTPGIHLTCTGKENMGYIGVALEEIFCAVKENSKEVTSSQKILVRMIFASLVRSYTKEELDQRLEAWRRSIENNKDFDGI